MLKRSNLHVYEKVFYCNDMDNGLTLYIIENKKGMCHESILIKKKIASWITQHHVHSPMVSFQCSSSTELKKKYVFERKYMPAPTKMKELEDYEHVQQQHLFEPIINIIYGWICNLVSC